jgi:enamine deaminase RidA (YjgF/YER057c/UK114 family)
MSVDDKLAELGIVLTEGTKPVANYVSSRRLGNVLYVSGHICKRDGVLITGKLGAEVDVQTGYELARGGAIDILGTVRSALGSLESVAMVRLTGYVSSAPGFTEQPAVVNGASDLLVQVLGDRGRHARSAIGVAQLPLGAAVEIEAIFEVLGEQS